MDREDSGSGQAQRSRLLSATDKLSEGQRRLEDSHRVALETEDLGAGILRDLRGQRDQLEHTRDNVRVRVGHGESCELICLALASFTRLMGPLIEPLARSRRWSEGRSKADAQKSSADTSFL